jgi:hypothetical protein
VADEIPEWERPDRQPLSRIQWWGAYLLIGRWGPLLNALALLVVGLVAGLASGNSAVFEGFALTALFTSATLYFVRWRKVPSRAELERKLRAGEFTRPA